MVCQTLSSFSIGPYTIEQGQICVTGLTEGMVTVSLKIGPLSYTKTLPWYSLNAQSLQELGSSSGRIYLIGTNPISSLFVDDILTLTEYAQKIANVLGYPGSFTITNVGLTNTLAPSGCGKCTVYIDYNASSPTIAIALVIALVIVFVIALILGIYFISAVVESFQPSPPTPPPPNSPPTLYQEYYQEYVNYLKQKQVSSISGGLFGTSTAIAVLGLGILAFLALSDHGGDK